MRKLAYLLITVLALSNFCLTSVQAVEEDASYEIQMKAEVLSDIGIIDDVNIDDSPLTRGEFASMAVKMMGETERDYPVEFIDAADSEYEKAAETICALQCMSGYGDGTFGIDDNMTYMQVIKTLVCMAGYGEMAEVNGGFPNGYYSVAKSERILKISVADYNSTVKRSDVICMLYDLLKVKTLKLSEVQMNGGENYADYNYGGEFCYEKLRLIPGKGVVLGNYRCNLKTSEKLGIDELLIGDKVLKVKNKNVVDSLGRYVEYFADEENEKAVSIVYNDKKLDYKEIDAKDIISNDGKTVRYRKGDSAKSVTVNKNMQIVYNGSLLYSPKKEELNPKEGSVRLISTKDEGYDLMIITSLKSLIVEEAGKISDGFLMRFYNGKSSDGTDVWKISENDYENFIVVLGGIVTDISAISKGMTIDVAPQRYPGVLGLAGVKNAVIYASVATGVGTVQGKTEDEIYIGDDAYEISSAVDKSVIESIKIGENVTAYINTKGRFVGYKIKASKDNGYYYLINAAPKGEFANQAELKVVTSDGKITVLETNENINFTGYINGNYKSENISSKKLPDYLKNGGVVEKQLLKIRLDEDGFVKEVTAANVDGAGKLPGYSEDGFNMNKEWNTVNGAHIYQEGVSSINSNYTLSGSTLVFRLAGNIESEEEVTVGNNSLLATDSYYSNVQIYDADPQLNAAVVIILEKEIGGKTPDTTTIKSNVVIVDSVFKYLINGEKVTYGINGYKQGEKIKLIAASEYIADSMATNWKNIDGKNSDTAKFKNLKKGDIIQYSLDPEGYVDTLHVLHYYGQWAYAERVNGGALNAEQHRAAIHTTVGKVVLRPNPGLIWVESQYGTKAYQTGKVTIMVFDADADRIYKGSVADIDKDDIVFIRDMSYLESDLIVYKNLP